MTDEELVEWTLLVETDEEADDDDSLDEEGAAFAELEKPAEPCPGVSRLAATTLEPDGLV